MDDISNGSKRPNLTRADLAQLIQRQFDLPKATSAEMIDRIISLIQEALDRGQNVKIKNFGAFILRDKVARVGRNPKTMDEASIDARRVLTFRASKALRKKLDPSIISQYRVNQ